MLLKQIPHIHKNITHVGGSKFHGSMLYLTFQFVYAVISLQIEVGPVIIGLVVGLVAGFEDKWGDMVGLEKICFPIIKVAVMDLKEEYL